jgi:hypothetical protein
MNNRTLSLIITVASLGALCAPVMAASPEPGKSTATSAKTVTAKSCAKKAHKGACKNVAKSAPKLAPVKSAQ